MVNLTTKHCRIFRHLFSRIEKINLFKVVNATAIGCLGYVTLEVGTLSNFDLFFVDIGHVFTTYWPMSITIDVNKIPMLKMVYSDVMFHFVNIGIHHFDTGISLELVEATHLDLHQSKL